MDTDCLSVISKLRDGLGVVFDQFRQEDCSIAVQTQLDRWRMEAAKTISAVFGREEADTFNNLFVAYQKVSGSHDGQADAFLYYIQRVAAYFEALEAVVTEGALKGESSVTSPIKEDVDPARVFVVHGRNSAINKAVYSFLRAIRLNPFEWEEVVALLGGSPYVGDIIKTGMKRSKATVVILTPDEHVALREELCDSSDSECLPQLQPRPNVLFEAGMAVAFDESRAIFLEIGQQRSFSDIFGRHLVRIDNSPAKRTVLANRLRGIGCSVDISGTQWLTEGDFELAESLQSPNRLVALHTTIKLSQPEQVIVRAVASNKQMTKAELLATLNESEIKLDYYLQRLQDAGLVGAHLSMRGEATQYMLFAEGTKYAVEVLGLG